MKLCDLIIKLAHLAAEHPNAEVVYSIDDEGNHFNRIYFEPSLGNYDDGEFNSESCNINAICIN